MKITYLFCEKKNFKPQHALVPIWEPVPPKNMHVCNLTVGGVVVGSANLLPIDANTWEAAVHVEPPYENKGYATQLVSFATAFALAQGKTVKMTTIKPAVIRIGSKLGFRERP